MNQAVDSLRLDAYFSPAQLVAIDTRFRQQLLPNLLTARALNTVQVAGPGARFIHYEIAKIVANETPSVPVPPHGVANADIVNVITVPVVQEVLSLVVPMQVTFQELMAARFSRNPIDQRRIDAAAFHLQYLLNSIFLNGMGRVAGVLNVPGRNENNVPNGNWSSPDTTGDKILEDLRFVVRAINVRDQLRTRVILLNTTHAENLTKEVSANFPIKTVREKIVENGWVASPEAILFSSTVPSNKVIVLDNDVSRMEFSLELPPERSEEIVLERDGTYSIYWRCMTAGGLFYFPEAISIGVGI